MLKPSLLKNDRLANILIWTCSLAVFLVVVSLKYIQLDIELPFNPHLFATINAFINGTVAITLVAALAAVKNKQYEKHKKIMLSSMVLSLLFLLSYIAHHILTGDTPYPVDAPLRWLYFIILFSHILLAAVILPFILFTTYRGLIGEFPAHKKIAIITWPIWFYVAISGVVVYLFISPYYV